LKRIDVPVTAVNSLEDLFSDPQLEASGLFEDYQHPTEGQLRGTRHPIRSAAPPRSGMVAPHLGEHTRTMLAAVGYTDAEIDAMVASGAAIDGAPESA
jgi:crotonobetainyl-CoA:carnitine CoA-transferase CaiB-like acyl-CoA transferase